MNPIRWLKKPKVPQRKKERVTDKLSDSVENGADYVFGDFDSMENPASNDSSKE